MKYTRLFFLTFLLSLTAATLTRKINDLRLRLQVPPLVWKPQIVRSVGDLVIYRAMQAGLPPHIALVTAQRESKLIPDLVSPPDKDGGRNWGVMQLHDCGEHLHLGCTRWTLKQLTDTDENIQAGIAYLKKLQGLCRGNEQCVHHAYLTGEVKYRYVTPRLSKDAR